MRHNRAVPRPAARVRPARRTRAIGWLVRAFGLAATVLPAAAAAAEGAGSAAPEVGPAVVFSAARAVCSSPSSGAGASSTAWLLDGAPIAGATSTTYTPPRADDGHLLSCSESRLEGGVPRTLTSPARTVHEQPPQPSWPISHTAGTCAAPVCMQEGAAPGAVGEAYAQAEAWWGAQQVRCVSAPWTSIVGDSALAAVKPFAEAHAVRLELQRLDAAGPVTVASGQMTALVVASDALDGPQGPFGAAVVAPLGSQPFADGEVWSRVFPAARGRPNWFAAGNGLLAYALTGPAPRSLQLTYTLTPRELGTELRCVAGAADGPLAAPTEATFAAPAYTVSAEDRCAPRRLAPLAVPQPALLQIGDPRCLAAPSALPAVGPGLQAIAVKQNRLALAVSCSLPGGCRGRIALLGAGGKALAALPLRMRAGAERLARISLGPAAVRRVARAGHAGLPVTVTLATGAGSRRIASARLIGR